MTDKSRAAERCLDQPIAHVVVLVMEHYFYLFTSEHVQELVVEAPCLRQRRTGNRLVVFQLVLPTRSPRPLSMNMWPSDPAASGLLSGVMAKDRDANSPFQVSP